MADKFEQHGKSRPYHAFGAALQRRRKRKYSQEGFAGVVGVHRDTVGSWERGESFPSRDYWPTIERELNFTEQEVDRLLGNGGDSGSDHIASGESSVALSGRGLLRADHVTAQPVHHQDNSIDDPALLVDTAPRAGTFCKFTRRTLALKRRRELRGWQRRPFAPSDGATLLNRAVSPIRFSGSLKRETRDDFAAKPDI